MKQCHGCKRDRPAEQWGKHPTWCLRCLREYGRRRYREVVNPTPRGYRAPEKRCPSCGLVKDREAFGTKRSGRWRSVRDICRACAVQAGKVWTASDRGQVAKRAGRKVAYAIRTGQLQRPGACEECLIECTPDAAHGDYDKPLEVRWLCRSCHVRWDQADPKTSRFLYAK